MIALATSLWLALRAAFAVQIGNPADLSRRVPRGRRLAPMSATLSA